MYTTTSYKVTARKTLEDGRVITREMEHKTPAEAEFLVRYLNARGYQASSEREY